jgi:hypothetical protein
VACGARGAAWCDAEGPGERHGAGVAAACGMGKVRGRALI